MLDEDMVLSTEGVDYVNDTHLAEHPYGVLYQGPWETLNDGSNRAVRLHARALAGTGIPVRLKSFNHSVLVDGVAVPVFDAGVDETVDREVRCLFSASISQTVPMIRHIVPRSAESLRQLLVPRSVIHEDITVIAKMREGLMRSNILYTVWERDRIPAEIANVMKRVALCWVPCLQNAVALEVSGVPFEKIEVIPHPFDPSSRLAVEGPKRSSTGRKDFLAVGIWQPRKAMHEALGAWLRVFEPDEATLVMKTTPTQWPGYPSPQDSIRLWIEDDRVRAKGWTLSALKGRFRMITSKLTDEEMVNLHLNSNIYLSPSHGEAWGLGAYDAKVAGNRLVHVPWGGTADFAGPDDVAVPFKLGPVDEGYHWEEGTSWANYDIEALEDSLRRVEPPKTHRRAEMFDACYSILGVGRHMALSVLEVAEQVNPKAAEYMRSLYLKG